jgi:hypothetical protein
MLDDRHVGDDSDGNGVAVSPEVPRVESRA